MKRYHGFPREPYRREPSPPIRDLLKTRAEHVKHAAFANGWRRERVELDGPGGAPTIYWRGPGDPGVLFPSDDPEVMPSPLREATYVILIAVFTRCCRLCGAKAEWLTIEQAAAADKGRVWTAGLQQGRYVARDHVFAIEHLETCPVRPANIEQMVLARSN